MDEHPAEAVRSKRDSSIVVGCRLVKEGKAAGFFSAGSTGACMAAATLVMGRVKGVTRPAIATVLPAPAGSVVLLDAGANADVRPDMLLQFAQMGAIYAAGGLGLEQPRIGLLNIGEEDTKGSLLVQEAYGLLKEQVQGFVGNIEGTELLAGKCDVVVTDGFTGNVVLKTVEGAVGALFKQLKAVFGASAKGKLAAALVQGDLRALKDTLSAEKVGGAPLLGVKGVAIIGHGSSSAAAVANGILATAHCARARIPELIAERLST
jgi:glycerol-3-phosphate acyltransferase PlsX